LPRLRSWVRTPLPAPNSTGRHDAFPFLFTGWVAEWSCSGLQSRVRRFNSDPSLHSCNLNARDFDMSKRRQLSHLSLIAAGTMIVAACANPTLQEWFGNSAKLSGAQEVPP